MERIAHRAAVVAACAALGLLALGVSVASAFTNSYCGVLIAESTWCGDGTDHSYIYNRASYGGAGNVWVCERLAIAGSSTPRETATCNYNYREKTYSAGYPFLTHAEVEHTLSGGASHTISGYATT